MTDLEITLLCAEAMGFHRSEDVREQDWFYLRNFSYPNPRYDPLRNDAQVMALVKQFWMIIRGETTPLKPSPFWRAMMPEVPMYSVTGPNLNRAVSTCVAEWWAAKKGK